MHEQLPLPVEASNMAAQESFLHDFNEMPDWTAYMPGPSGVPIQGHNLLGVSCLHKTPKTARIDLDSKTESGQCTSDSLDCQIGDHDLLDLSLINKMPSELLYLPSSIIWIRLELVPGLNDTPMPTTTPLPSNHRYGLSD